MKQDIHMSIDMTEDSNDVMMVTYHDTTDQSVSIHAASCPATIQLTLDQAFHLMVELQSLFRKVSLPLKERG